MKITLIQLPKFSTMALIALTVGATSLQAAVVVTNTEYDSAANGGGGIAAASSNSYGSNVALASAGSTLAQNNFTSVNGSAISYLTDGNLGANTNENSTNEQGTAHAGGNSTWTLTINLNTSAAPLGYTINEINVISGSSYKYVNQNYTVSYSTDGTNFTNLDAVTFNYASANDFMSMQTSLKGPGSDPLGLTNVVALQFSFDVAPIYSTYTSFASYREVEAFGVATPEPSTYALALGGLAVLATLRRRSVRAVL